MRLSASRRSRAGRAWRRALEGHGLEPFATVPNAVGPAPPATVRGKLEADWGLSPRRGSCSRSAGSSSRRTTPRYPRNCLGPGSAPVIAGEGPLRPELERTAAEPASPTGRRSLACAASARALMGAADAVVMPSRWEGLPLAALEALASGTPLVATSVRGLRELVVDGRDALLVPEEPEPRRRFGASSTTLVSPPAWPKPAATSRAQAPTARLSRLPCALREAGGVRVWVVIPAFDAERTVGGAISSSALADLPRPRGGRRGRRLE